MFEISQLNEKKLSDLQEIAQKLNVPKFRSLKKSDRFGWLSCQFKNSIGNKRLLKFIQY